MQDFGLRGGGRVAGSPAESSLKTPCSEPDKTKKLKIHQWKYENPEEKLKILGIKNFELDMLDTVFRPKEHDALG